MPNLRVNDWVLDTDRNLLVRGSRSVRLEPKVADLLRALQARAGEVVSKHELIRLVWGDIAVSDEVLTTAIYQLRRALEDDRVAPRYIETVPRRGYRLMVNAEPVLLAAPKWRIVIASVTAALLLFAALAAYEGRRTDRIIARELHAVARDALHRGVHLASAAHILRRASELDPANGAIAGSLALALALEGSDLEAGRSAADRALRIDRTNTDALTARSLVALWADWNWRDATTGLRQAAESGDPIARAWFAYIQALRGHPERAAAVARGLDSPPLAAGTASTALLLAGSIDGAETVAAAAARRDPGNAMLARQLQKVRDRRLERAGGGSLHAPVDLTRPTDVARLHLAQGNVEAALQALENAWRQRDRHLLFVRVDSRWDPIRSHPRFRSIAASVGP